MKKVLFASTILASLGTVASAETGVTISGYGRFGLVYDSTDRTVVRDVVVTDANGNETVETLEVKRNKTLIHTRLRFNLDAKTETDSGVNFGGRIRIQDSDQGGSGFNAAQLYTTWEGLRVEVGNANTALDSVALFYDSEMGLRDTSYGDSLSDFFAYSSAPYSSSRTGLYTKYTFAGFTVHASYINPDQVADIDIQEEISLAAAYETDLFSVAAGMTWDGAGIKDNDVWFLGAAYNVSDVAAVGINYINEGYVTSTDGTYEKDSATIVVYGNYTMDAVTLRAYIGHNDQDGWDTKTSYGLGADYDLGGAKLTGSVQRSYDSETYADFGVRFDF